MAGQTTNLHLKKPEYSESADVAVFNENMDTIDAAAKALQDDKIDKTSIVNTLEETSEGKVLDARQGKALDDKKIDKTSIANTLTETDEGKALDARQGKALDEKKVNWATNESQGKFLQTNENGEAFWGDPFSDTAVATAVDAWMDEHTGVGSFTLDDTLTGATSAAQAKAAGDGIKAALANEAPVFNASSTYKAGQYVTYGGVLYRLTADHAADVTWASTSKVASNLGGEVTDLKSAFFTEMDSISIPNQLSMFYLGKTANWGSNTKRALSNPIKVDNKTVFMNIKTLPSDLTAEVCFYNTEDASSYQRGSTSISAEGLSFVQYNYPYARVLLASTEEITQAKVNSLVMEVSAGDVVSAYDKIARDTALSSANLLTDHNNRFTFSNNTINDSTGILSPSLTRVASIPIAVEKDTKIGLKDYTSYNFVPYFYNIETGAYIGNGSADWLSADYTVPAAKDKTNVRILVRKSNNANISPSEAQFQLKFTDTETKKITELQTAISNTETDITNIQTQIGEVIKSANNLIGNCYGRFLFENGRINDSTGEKIDSTIRVRSFPIAVEKGQVIGLNDYTNYRHQPYFYNMSTGAYLGHATDTWMATDYVVEETYDKSYMIDVICKSDDSTILPSAGQLQLIIKNEEKGIDDQIYALQRESHKDVFIAMTHNVGLFNDGSGTHCPDADVTTRKAMFKQLIEKYRPDIIFTQESPEYMNVSNNVLGSSVYLPYYAIYEGTLENGDIPGYMGRHIATSYPLIDTEKVSHGGGTRSYVKSYTYINNVKVALFDIHLGLTAEQRATEITNLLSDMATEEYFICGGDFNAEYADEVIAFTNAGYNVANKDDFVTDSGGGHIDNFVTSANIKMIHIRMDSTIFASMHDHNPLIAYFVIGNTANVPDIPKQNGQYTLKATVNNGAVSYEWVAIS